MLLRVMETLKELKELGLDDNEANVYTACLAEGSSKVQDIAKRSGLIRTTVYGILKSLINKGLVSTVKKNNKLFFQAVPPRELLNIWEQKKEKLSLIIPQLEKLRSTIPCLQKVEFFEGRSGVKTVVNDIISKPKETIKLISEGKRWLEFSSSFTSVYYRKKKR